MVGETLGSILIRAVLLVRPVCRQRKEISMDQMDSGTIGIMIAVAGVIILPIIIIKLAQKMKKVADMKAGKTEENK